jgi:O-antigen/teichoic acid export membrane protein
MFRNQAVWQTLLALGDQFVVSGTRFITTWMIARLCGAEQLGYFALGISGLMLIDLLLQAFVSAPYTIYSQQLSSRRLDRYTGDALVQASMVGVFGLVTFMLIGSVATLASSLALANVMFIVAIVSTFYMLREFTRRQCLASKQNGLALILDLIFALVQLGAMYGLHTIDRLDSTTALASSGLACAMTLAVWFAAARRKPLFSTRSWRISARKHWRFGRWVFVSQATNQLNWSFVQWAIAFWLSTEAMGVFAGCLTIAFLSNPFVFGITNLIYPHMARIRNEQGSMAVRRIAVFAMSGIGLVMATFTAGMTAFGQLLCDILYADPAYANVHPLPGVLAAAVAILAITMPMDGFLWSERRTDLSSATSAIGFVATTIAVAVLVRWGVTAAAVGLLIGCMFEVAARSLFYVKLRPSTPLKPYSAGA